MALCSLFCLRLTQLLDYIELSNIVFLNIQKADVTLIPQPQLTENQL